MHEMLWFAGQNVSQKMCGEACPADGCGTRSVRVGVILKTSTFKNRGKSLTKASFSHSTFTFSGTSRTKASFSHPTLPLLRGGLARIAFLRVSR